MESIRLWLESSTLVLVFAICDAAQTGFDGSAMSGGGCRVVDDACAGGEPYYE